MVSDGGILSAVKIAVTEQHQLEFRNSSGTGSSLEPELEQNQFRPSSGTYCGTSSTGDPELMKNQFRWSSRTDEEPVPCQFRNSCGTGIRTGQTRTLQHTHTPTTTHLLIARVLPYNTCDKPSSSEANSHWGRDHPACTCGKAW